MATITGKDIQEMVRHWLNTPVCGYLGSGYGQDAKALLQLPQADGGVTIDLPAGKRYMQTLRKLPITAPMTKYVINKRYKKLHLPYFDYYNI